MKPKVVIGDDHQILAAGLSKLIENDYEVAATACNGRELLRLIGLDPPDIAIIDISMPSLNGIEVARQISRDFPAVRIVILSQHDRAEYVRAAFEAGAKAYVVKQSAAIELVTALETVQAGRFYMSGSILPDGRPLVPAEGWNSGELFGAELTSRQRQVLQLVAEGKSGKEIAISLDISLKTVEFHKAKLTRQLNLHTTAELTRYAIEHGIV